MATSFVRTVKRENPFVQIDKGYIGVGNLSLKATGLLTYFLSKPDGWKINLSDVKNRFKDGEDSIRSALNELRDNFYVNRYQERGEAGKFGVYIYEVYERPEYNPMFQKKEFQVETPKRENPETVIPPKRDFPETVFPETDFPETENPVYSNNESINNESSNNKYNNINDHLLEKMGTKQKDLFVKFSKKTKIDDDFIQIFIDRIIKYKPNSMKYITSIYETIVNEQSKSQVNKKETGSASLPKCMTDENWQKEDMSPEEVEKRAKELDEFLNSL